MNIELEAEALRSLSMALTKYVLGTTLYTEKGIFNYPNNYDGRQMKFRTVFKDGIYEMVGYRQEEKIPLEDGSHKIKSTFVIEYCDRPTEIKKYDTKSFEDFLRYSK
jgi:hypothetical protein